MHYQVVSDIYAIDNKGVTFLLMNGDTLMDVKKLANHVEANYFNNKLQLNYNDFNNKVVYRNRGQQ